MYPQQPQPGPTEIRVRYKKSVSILYIVLGSLLLAIALWALLNSMLSYWIILGPLLLAAGIVSLSVPIIRFEPTTATMTMHGPFGNKVRTFGAPKGERISFDGTTITRQTSNGKTKKIRTGSGEPEDVQRLHQTLWAMQQQQQQ